MILLLFFCLLIGKAIQCHLCSQEDERINSLTLGFVFIVSIFQLVALPFLYFKTSFSILSYIILVLVLMCVCVALFYILRMRIRISVDLKSKTIFFWGAILVIFVQILMYIFLLHSDADDSYYLAQITTTLESDKLAAFDPSTGNIDFPFQSQYALVGYEVFLAILCSSLHVNVAFFCHSILPVFLLIIFYALMYDICRKIGSDEKDKLFLLLALINLFSGYSAWSRGAFLLFRLWQGKAVLVNIAMPFLFLIFYNVFKKKEIKWGNIILLTMILYFGFCMSAIGIYILPIMYAMYTITFFLYTFDIKKTFRLVIPILFLLPAVIIKYILIKQDTVVGFITDSLRIPSYIDVLKNLNGSGYMLIGWILALIIIIVLGNQMQRYFYGGYTIVCFLTVLNPLFRVVIAKNITGSSVYWRLFWILQFSSTFLTAFSLLYKRIYRKTIILIPVVIGLLCCGKLILTKENYSVADNKEKISTTTKEIVTAIEQDDLDLPHVLMPLDYAIETRQYTGKIILAWSRYSRMAYCLIGQEELYNELLLEYNEIYSEGNYDKLDDLVKKLDVDYIVLYNNDKVIESDEQFRMVYQNADVVVYQTCN